MWPSEYHALIKREHYRDELARAEHARLAAALRSPRRPFARFAAGVLGGVLIRLGVALLRYDRVENTTIPGTPRSIDLN